ncbi:MAG: NAD(P)/FAD-dependent oxidoreductase [Cyclobacteriaceae bacterium]|nr:NAD(P)/FAD-dependent oxidoreductase [Cyclobacteriaceae bacterium]
MKKIAIVGGGLAGLIAAIRLGKAGLPCLLFEKKVYPFHRVCGEYISNEVLPFLKKEQLFPENIQTPRINVLQLSSVSGKTAELSLDMGGFGISRYAFDYFLAQQAVNAGVEIIHEEVDAITFYEQEKTFSVTTGRGSWQIDFVIGSFGKRSRLDINLQRSFIEKRSPYVGIKYHIRTQHPDNVIALHNFNGGYCGISNIEDGKSTLCYLAHRDLLKKHKSISALEKEVLFQNPHLERIFTFAEFLFGKPETINEISFETKEPVFNHILMAGDAAGMIAPLCGNGMAMAIHTGKLVSDIVTEAINHQHSREWVEAGYTQQWKKLFQDRLRTGRVIQNYLFGSVWSSRLAVSLAVNSNAIANYIARRTHGEIIQ